MFCDLWGDMDSGVPVTRAPAAGATAGETLAPPAPGFDLAPWSSEGCKAKVSAVTAHGPGLPERLFSVFQ